MRQAASEIKIITTRHSTWPAHGERGIFHICAEHVCICSVIPVAKWTDPHPGLSKNLWTESK